MNAASKMVQNPETGRFETLRRSIDDYERVKSTIKTGIEDSAKIREQRKRIMSYLNATEVQWNDYKWQLQNRFCTVEGISDILGLAPEEKKRINMVAQKYRFGISPYYLSLIDPDNKACPIKNQSVPSFLELNEKGELDPMDEEGWTPEEAVTRRYPDRLIIKVTNMCGMYCRFCQRRRLIGEHDSHTQKEKLKKAVEYVRRNPEIRDVLLTGGDAFLLDDRTIDWILQELRSIEHVEIIRLGTRTPVTLPQRVTPELAGILKKYHPVYVNTHFNHPREITEDAARACGLLADAGIPLGNQMVLLKNVNDDKFVVRKLNQSLLRIRVKPYYIFHPKHVKGTTHFGVKIEVGLEIMDSLRGYTSGLAIPSYIVNAPDGLGKTPILPNYLSFIGEKKVVFRNWQGKRFEIVND